MRHGKGDKPREVPLLGDFALEALERWKAAQSRVAGERQYVFCPLKKSRNVLGGDRPMPDTDVYRVVKATEQRTLLTEHIDQTGDVPRAQRIAGHANEATTLRYAQAVKRVRCDVRRSCAMDNEHDLMTTPYFAICQRTPLPDIFSRYHCGSYKRLNSNWA